MSTPTAILYGAEDARRFAAERPDARALTLTPDARAVLAGAGMPFSSSDQVYGAVSHQRALIRIARANARILKACGAALDGRPAARATLTSAFHIYAASAVRAERTLRAGPWLFPAKEKWRRLESRADACRALMRRFATEPLFNPLGPPPLAGLVRALAGWTARAAARGRPVAFGNIDKGFADLAAEIARRPNAPPVLSFRPAAGTWHDLARAMAGIAQLTARRPAMVTVVPEPPDPDLANAVRAALAQSDDPAISIAMEIFGDELRDLVVTTDGLARAAAALMIESNARAHPSYSMRWTMDAALGEAAWRAGIPRPLMSHGTHPPAQDTTGRAALSALADGLLVSPMTDLALVQTPHAERAARDEMPGLKLQRIRPLVWGHRTAARREPRDRFRILHAGTYKAWRSHRPWIYETSDEFAAGLISLAEAVASLAGEVELVIRIRPQAECAVESLEALIPRAANVSIKAAGSFLDDLAGADLLASYSSTTIEEALNLRVPVLLWGGGPPYRHLPARETPPTEGDRAAVYAAMDHHMLPAMLRSIAECHRGRPLTDAEIAPHAWTGRPWDRGAVCDWLLGANTETVPAAAPSGTVPMGTTTQ